MKFLLFLLFASVFTYSQPQNHPDFIHSAQFNNEKYNLCLMNSSECDLFHCIIKYDIYFKLYLGREKFYKEFFGLSFSNMICKRSLSLAEVLITTIQICQERIIFNETLIDMDVINFKVNLQGTVMYIRETIYDLKKEISKIEGIIKRIS